MRTKYKRLITNIFSVFILTSLPHSEIYAVETLGQYPLCEASAAITIPCPYNSNRCLLVADNEQRNNLFLFTFNKHTINSNKQEILYLENLKNNGISDIEAIAGLSDNELIIFGSHSRNKRCKTKKNRRRYALAKIHDNVLTINTFQQSDKISCKSLFGHHIQNNTLLNAACNAIYQEEVKSESDCKNSHTYNAEGAVALRSKDRVDIWIGLRSPLLPEHPAQPEYKNLAILLHMKDINHYNFDKIALIDLDGRGIRELTVNNNYIWIIAGPPGDKIEAFQLFRFAQSALNDSDIIKPEFIRDLPPSSEGLAIFDKKAIVVTDGDIGNNPNTQCLEPSRYLEIELH